MGDHDIPQHDHIRRCQHHIRTFKLQFGCRMMRCARHVKQLEPPWAMWAMLGNVCTPQADDKTLLSHLGGPQHIPTIPHSALVPIYMYRIRAHLNCGLGVVWWCARHLQQLRPPWGTAGNATHTPGMVDDVCLTARHPNRNSNNLEYGVGPNAECVVLLGCVVVPSVALLFLRRGLVAGCWFLVASCNVGLRGVGFHRTGRCRAASYHGTTQQIF